MNRWAKLAVVLAVWLVAAPAAAAENLPIDAFYGQFTGTGVANSRDADVLNLKKRDLDVTIAPEGKGFSVAWTTVRRRNGFEEVSRSSAKMVFEPTASPQVFLAPDRTDPMGESGYSWATLEGKTLTVYIVVVNPKDGAYQLHSYERTLEKPDEMRLKFNRISKGRPRVIVEGELSRKK